MWLVIIDPFYSSKYPDFINFIGHVDKNNFLGIILSVIFLSSIFRRSFINYFEAMSVGFQLYALKILVEQEIINQNSGFIVPANHLTISRTIKELYLNKEKLAQMSKAAKQTSINNFNWSNFVQKMQSINL